MDFLAPVIAIILMDIVLSGDNAVVIGMAAHGLPAGQRRTAIALGGASAVALRALNTSIATILLQIPALKLVGGLLLVWIAFKLLREEEEGHERHKATGTLHAAIATIMLADFVMSLDNVLAVAAVARGNVPLLLFGLFLSMPIVLFCGSIVASLVDRLWWLAYVGASVIAWTGATMMLEDEVVNGYLLAPNPLQWAVPALAVIATVMFSRWFNRRQRREHRAAVAER